jgi:hypothetical protein
VSRSVATPVTFQFPVSGSFAARQNQSSVGFPCSIVRDGSEPLISVSYLFFVLLFLWSFFCALLFGFGLSPFTEKDRETGRLVGVVFRGHHESPLRSRAGEGEKRNPMQRGVKREKT